MTNLERFNRIVNFKKVDRPPRWETSSFWDETLEKWHKENGIPLNTDLMNYYGFDHRPIIPGLCDSTEIPYNPAFEEKIIEEKGDVIVKRNAQGIILKYQKNVTSMPQWLEFPVKNQKDWEKIKSRLDAKKYEFGDFEETKSEFLTNPDPNGLQMCGLYGWYRNLFGTVNLSYAFHDYPILIHSMGKHWLEFYGQVTTKIVKETRTDYVTFFEDMAYKTGPLIGPTLFKEFMTPYYKEIIAHFKGFGIKTFFVDTDGNTDILLPLFAEVGVNAMVPFEVAAGNDILRIRDQYPSLIILGGIDKRVLECSKEEIKKEVVEKVPVMWKKGGYIPSLDHSVPPVPKENWEYCLDLVRSICR